MINAYASYIYECMFININCAHFISLCIVFPANIIATMAVVNNRNDRYRHNNNLVPFSFLQLVDKHDRVLPVFCPLEKISRIRDIHSSCLSSRITRFTLPYVVGCIKVWVFFRRLVFLNCWLMAADNFFVCLFIILIDFFISTFCLQNKKRAYF